MQTTGSLPQTSRAGVASLGVDIRQLAMLVALIAVWIVFQALTFQQPGSFFSAQNLFNLVIQTSVVGIMVGGMVLVIVTRQIDLSVGSVLGFTAMTLALLQAPNPLGAGLPWWLTVLAALGVGAIIGAFSGSFIAFLGVPSFVVTLAGLLIFRNGTFVVASGRTITLPDPTFQSLGSGSIGATATWIIGVVASVVVVYLALSARSRRAAKGFAVRPMWAEALVTGASVLFILGFAAAMNAYIDPRTSQPAGIPIPALIAISVLIFLAWMTRATRFGRYIYAIGGNPEAANLAGINVKRMTVYIFMLMGVLTAIGAVVQAARLTAATTNLGRDLELEVIAGAVIGGTVLAGGSGTIFGAALGALLTSSLRNGMVLMGIATEWQNIVLGAVLLLAVLFNTVVSKRSAR
jgi:D-xylose transport system permease protein